MKQVLENLRNGDISVDEIPTPTIKPGQVLVRNHFSLISTGTEGGTVKLGKMSYIGKAKARPEQVQKVIKVVRTQGLLTAYRAVDRSLDIPIALGYSCAGEVIKVGADITDLSVGDTVACAGAGLANHAEIVAIPRNLCVPVPSSMNLKYAAFATVGAIAMQGVRIANVKLGENIVVIGLGLVGILTAQILRAAGANVFGIDVDENQLSYVNKLNICKTENFNADNLIEQVMSFSGGNGADSVI
ncbi:MAG: zinc-binding alcohol dehydrogenase, partial [Gammaproteobacteria bacterium]|nr:zinc-binding alcohol dehydrogenase [Gammaproteobacteria bacterium]